MTTAGDFIIIYFSRETLGLGSFTAWRWFWVGKLPVPTRQLPTGTILVEAPRPEGITVLYARVSSADQREDLERQVQRLQAFAQEQGWTEKTEEAAAGFAGPHGD